MKAWIYDKLTGELLWQVESGEAQLAAQESEAHGVLMEVEADPAQHFVSGGVLADRPLTGLPDLWVTTAGADWSVDGVPAQTRVLIDGEQIEDGVVGTTGLTIRFDYAESYLLELLPPFPWRAAKCRVTVN